MRARVRDRHLNDIEQQNDRLALVFKVHCHSDKGTMIRRGPRVRCEAAATLVFLQVKYE